MKRFDNKQTGILSSSELKTVKGKSLYWTFFAILAIVAVISLIPAVWTVCTALKDTQEIYSEFSFFPKNLSWSKAINRVSESWAELQLGKTFLNTIVLSLGSLVFRIVVCGFGGYVLSKLKPWGTTFVFTLTVWTMMMPSQIRMVPNYMTYLHFPFAANIGGINLLNTYWPMWLSAGADAFAVLLFKNAFDALSQSYVEAARIDGCGNFGIFFRIMLPLAAPVLIYESVNVLTAAWSDFFTPLLVLNDKEVLPLKIYRLKSDMSIEMNTYFMSLVFASIPALIIYIIFQKQIVGGVNVGGVKG